LFQIRGKSDGNINLKTETAKRVAWGGVSLGDASHHPIASTASTKSKSVVFPLQPFPFLSQFVRSVLARSRTKSEGGEKPVDKEKELNGPSGKERESQPAVIPAIRILLVEDSTPIQKVMKHYLNIITGCVVTVADDGQYGLDLLKTEEFDLIITDFVMVSATAESTI